jgi:hypothetical protein
LAGAFAKSKDTSEGLHFEMRADMCIPDGLLFMWVVVPSFPFAVSVATSQKNSILALENRKHTFGGTKRKSASVAFLAITRATSVSNMASF